MIFRLGKKLSRIGYAAPPADSTNPFNKLSIPISRVAFSGESEACAALTIMLVPNSLRMVPGGALAGSVGPRTAQILAAAPGPSKTKARIFCVPGRPCSANGRPDGRDPDMKAMRFSQRSRLGPAPSKPVKASSGVPSPRPAYSRNQESRMSVTGPSLTRDTSIMAPKVPVATGLPSTLSIERTKFS